MRGAIVTVFLALFSPALCAAAESRISVPLPDIDIGVDLQDINDWVLVRGLNSAFGDGFNARVAGDELVVRFDADKLPEDWDQSCDALTRFTSVAAPEAVGRQNLRFGLHLPRVVDAKRPLVVLIHGLDGDRGCCDDLAALLHGEGYQTAIFAYPAERPLDESAEFFSRNMRLLGERFPAMRIDLITESMGGLVARKYVEGPEYAGGVDHFILIAPPNEGSTWTPYSFLLKLTVNAWKWQHDPEWNPAWMITEGIEQAANDLRPESTFLAELNSHPRRVGVRYTIVAGDRPVEYRLAAELLDWSSELVGDRVGNWWGVREIKSAARAESRTVAWAIGG